MKSIVKILPVLLAITLLTSCSNFGKKVNVEGTKGEVYYKGEGVTEADAKKLGEFLKTSEFFNNEKVKSVQITKSGDRYTVHFVVDKDVLTKIPTAEQGFKYYTVAMSKQVFGGKKADVALSDDRLKDFKTIPYDEAMAQAGNNTTGNTSADDKEANSALASLADYDHDVAGGITFYWKGISDDESKTIAEYIVKSGSFSGGNGNVNIIMEKQGDRYLVKFPVADAYVGDNSYLGIIETVSKQIKKNVFSNTAYTFVMTDTNLKEVRSWEY